MPEGTVPLLIALIVLILMSGFFSSTETAYSCCSRIKLRSWISNGNKKAKKVLELAEENYDNLITTLLVGNNIVNLTAATLSTILFAKLLANSNVDSSFISTVVITVVVLIFGEITPKFMAKSMPEKMAMFYYNLIMPFYYLFYPVNLLFKGWKWILSKIFRFKTEDVITEDEIMTVVEEAEEDGTIREEETNLIRSVIEFDDVEVGDILVPRVNIVAVDVDSSMEDIKKVFDKEGYSRLPVYKNSIDTIIGTIHEKDFYKAYLKGAKSLNDILQKALYTTEHAKISKLLKQLQNKKVHMAVVLDEYGGTLGIITLEDILEELVGEIWDEHDQEINYIKEIGENQYIAEGNARISDVFEFFGIDEEENDADSTTLSGWLIENLGEIPRSGIKFDFKNLTFQVIKSTVKRVLQVKITVSQETEEE